MNDPVELLIDLAEKTKKQREVQKHQDSLVVQWQGVAFLCGDYSLMTPLSTILEICPCPKLMPIPGVQSWFRGIANLRGDILPITDLQSLLFQKKIDIEKSTPVLVVQYQGELVGFLVNKIIALHRIPKGEPVPLSRKGDPAFLPYVSEEIRQEEERFSLFDFYKLIEGPIFSRI